MRARRGTRSRWVLPGLCVLLVLLVGFSDALADKIIPNIGLPGFNNFRVLWNPDSATSVIQERCFSPQGSLIQSDTVTIPEGRTFVDPLPPTNDIGWCVAKSLQGQNFGYNYVGGRGATPLDPGAQVLVLPGLDRTIGFDGSGKVLGGSGLPVNTFGVLINPQDSPVSCDANVFSNVGNTFTRIQISLGPKQTRVINYSLVVTNTSVSNVDYTCPNAAITVSNSLTGYHLYQWSNSVNGEPINGEEGSAEIQTP
jgi:hypothetical protein